MVYVGKAVLLRILCPASALQRSAWLPRPLRFARGGFVNNSVRQAQILKSAGKTLSIGELEPFPHQRRPISAATAFAPMNRMLLASTKVSTYLI